MKISEMNERQKKVFFNIKYAAQWLIGGLENTLSDNPEDSIEYQIAFNELNNHDLLVEELYQMSTTDLYEDGMCCFNQDAKRYIKDVRFCGKDWIMERCEARITKEGY